MTSRRFPNGRVICAFLAAAPLAFVIAVTTLQADPQDRSVPEVTTISEAPGALMRAKLTASQEVMEGLIRKDFDQVAKGAERMKQISEAAEWPRARDAVYEHFAAEFRRQCNELSAMAADLNQTGVKFAYLNLTATCINCHDYVRDSLRVADIRGRSNVSLIPSEWPADRVAPHAERPATSHRPVQSGQRLRR